MYGDKKQSKYNDKKTMSIMSRYIVIAESNKVISFIVRNALSRDKNLMCYAICHLQQPGFATFARIHFVPPHTMEIDLVLFRN